LVECPAKASPCRQPPRPPAAPSFLISPGSFYSSGASQAQPTRNIHKNPFIKTNIPPINHRNFPQNLKLIQRPTAIKHQSIYDDLGKTTKMIGAFDWKKMTNTIKAQRRDSREAKERENLAAFFDFTETFVLSAPFIAAKPAETQLG
jgi:hypothetical protein